LLRAHAAGQKYPDPTGEKHGQGKALTLLAQQLGRAVYDMLKRHKAFDMPKFLQES
jgi:hypothetical protein